MRRRRRSATRRRRDSRPQFGQEGDELDIRGLLLPFWRRKWIIALVTLIALALSVYAASQMQPRYTAFARVIFDPERMRIIDLESVIAARDITETGLQNQVEILRSFILLERVVDILRLEESPEFSPDEDPAADDRRADRQLAEPARLRPAVPSGKRRGVRPGRNPEPPGRARHHGPDPADRTARPRRRPRSARRRWSPTSTTTCACARSRTRG